MYMSRIYFHTSHDIPIIIIFALSATIALSALVFILLGRASQSRMPRYLCHTLAGRILTAFVYINDYASGAPRVDWIHAVEWKRIDLGDLHLRGTDATMGQLQNSRVAAANLSRTLV